MNIDLRVWLDSIDKLEALNLYQIVGSVISFLQTKGRGGYGVRPLPFSTSLPNQPSSLGKGA